MTDLERTLDDHLARLAAQGRRRRLRSADRQPAPGGAPAFSPPAFSIDGRAVVDFSSNDYLGLATHPALIQRAQDWAARWGAGAAASRLVTGNLAPFAALEAKVAAAKGCDSALVMASGWQTNAGVLPALFALSDPHPALVFCDRLNHASMHHGCQAAGVRQIRYHHNDLAHLDALLAKHHGQPGLRFVVTETVFSMDGDRADVAALAALAERHDAILYLDEAHATGVLGPTGFGLAAGLASPRAVVMGTFSKALGGFGAYLACSAKLRDYLVNRCSGLVYSTALPPAVLGAIDAALDLVPTLGPQRARVLASAQRARDAWHAEGLDTGASSTQIVPIMLGDEARALAVAAALEAEGLLGIAIRPPTVPPGTSRIRFAFSANHADAEVDRLIDAVIRLVRRASGGPSVTPEGARGCRALPARGDAPNPLSLYKTSGGSGGVPPNPARQPERASAITAPAPTPLPTIVYVHGWGFDARVWAPLQRVLPGIAVDLGFTGTPDLPELRGPVLAVGHSLGLMWLLAARKYSWDRGLVAINGFARFTSAGDFPHGVAPRLVQRMAARLAAAPATVTGDFLRRCGVAAPALGTLDSARLAEGLDWLEHWDARPALAEYQASPTPPPRLLALAGACDPIVPPAMTAATFAAPTLHWCADGGHLLPLTHPAWCAERIAAFISAP